MTEEVDMTTTTTNDLIEAAEARFLEKWTAGPQVVRWSALPVQVGDAAPDLTLPDHTGAERHLREFWAEQPALIMFWRHFGCGCGLDRAQRLRSEYADYLADGLRVVIVGQGEPERAAEYRAAQELECPILVDGDESAYRTYGLLDATVSQVLFDAPAEMWSHDRATGEEFVRARHEQGRPVVDNPWLLPGEFVVNTDGVLCHAHRYQHCEDYPDPLVLRTAAKTC